MMTLTLISLNSAKLFIFLIRVATWVGEPLDKEHSFEAGSSSCCGFFFQTSSSWVAVLMADSTNAEISTISDSNKKQYFYCYDHFYNLASIFYLELWFWLINDIKFIEDDTLFPWLTNKSVFFSTTGGEDQLMNFETSSTKCSRWIKIEKFTINQVLAMSNVIR